jgi:uncharacterized membrane protein
LFVAALIGFADATYLTAEHIRGVIPPCGLTSNCDTVLTSKYASVGPIPVAAMGLLYYGAVIVLLIAYFDSYQRRILHWASWLISAGMLGYVYFVFVQAFVLHAWCMYCLGSALMTLIMFACAVRLMRID